jgi:hypothetical protein
MNVNAVTTATKSTPCLAKGNALTASGYRVESGASQQPNPFGLVYMRGTQVAPQGDYGQLTTTYLFWSHRYLRCV